MLPAVRRSFRSHSRRNEVARSSGNFGGTRSTNLVANRRTLVSTYRNKYKLGGDSSGDKQKDATYSAQESSAIVMMYSSSCDPSRDPVLCTVVSSTATTLPIDMNECGVAAPRTSYSRSSSHARTAQHRYSFRAWTRDRQRSSYTNCACLRETRGTRALTFQLKLVRTRWTRRSSGEHIEYPQLKDSSVTSSAPLGVCIDQGTVSS